MTARIQSIDFSKAIAKGPRIRTAANAAMTAAILTSTAPLVPYRPDSWALRTSGEVEANYTGGQVSWGNSDVPYARVQYYKYPHKRQPGTVGLWFEVAKKQSMVEWVTKAIQAAKQVCDE